MDIIIFRYNPKVISLENAEQQSLLIIAPSQQRKNYEALGLYHNVIYLDDFTLPTFFQTLRKLQQQNQITSITTLAEEDIDWVGLLADHFVNHNSLYASHSFFRDKYLMRCALIDIVNQPPFRLLASKEDLARFWQQTDYDTAVIKPRFGAGSENIIKVKRNELDLDSRYFTGQYLIEAFLPFKKMLTCDGIAIGEQIQAIFSHEYEQPLLDSLNNEKELVIRTNHLYQTHPQFLEHIFQACKHVLTTITTHNTLTPFHFEWFYDEQREIFYFCEVGKRFGGAKIPKLIKYSFGVDLLKHYWAILQGKQKAEERPILFPSQISTTYSKYNTAGQLINCPDKSEFDWCEEVNINVSPLQITENAQSVMDSAITVLFISQNEEEYQTKLTQIRQLASRFHYQENHGEKE